MSLWDSTVNRIYKCHNKECECEIFYEQKITDQFKVECPFCQQKTLLIENGKWSVSTVMEMYKGKTLGTLAEKNTEQMRKEGTLPRKKKPFWRKKSKIDYGVLKNPNRYILEGTK